MRVTIDQLGWRAEGLVRLLDGWIVVPGALPGEIVDVDLHPSHPRSHRIEATVVHVENPSDDRLTSPCRDFPRCRGCHLQHVSPEWARDFKRRGIAEVMSKYGPSVIDAGDVRVLGPAPENGARNRCNLVVQGGRAGLVSPSGLISMRDCAALTPACRDVIAAIEDRNPPDGHLQLLVPQTGPAVAVASDTLLAHMQGCGEVEARAAQDASPTAVRAGSIEMEASLDVWTHGSESASAPLYRWLATWFAPHAGNRLLELGCGIGSVAVHAVAAGLDVVGIDGSAPSVALAERNCPQGTFRAVSFERGCRELLMDTQRFDIAVINPMREPVGERVLSMLNALGVHTVVYLAPSPASGAKDLNSLVRHDEHSGWKLTFVGMVDLHPRTYHAMLVAVAER